MPSPQGRTLAHREGNMSKREFSKVSPALWRSERFTSLESKGQVLLLYFMTSCHQNSAGCYRLPDGYACSDLKWEIADYQAHRTRLIEADLIAFDEVTLELYIRRWFQHCPPMNDKHAQGTSRLISDIDSDALRETVEIDFTTANESRVSKTKPANVQPLHSSQLLNSRMVAGGGR
jgi:hypothetical protein